MEWYHSFLYILRQNNEDSLFNCNEKIYNFFSKIILSAYCISLVYSFTHFTVFTLIYFGEKIYQNLKNDKLFS